MIRLPEPDFSSEQTIDACISGITGNEQLRMRAVNTKDALLNEGATYMRVSASGQLWSIAPLDEDHEGAVLGDLSKSDLLKLYDQYLVPALKPARPIYDHLLNIAKEKCPFCGGLGVPHNLDHFLPQAHYPQYAILPRNLVPSCRDCNLGEKSDEHVTIEDQQIIHPYSDKEKYFSEQWIYARYRSGAGGIPGTLEYYVQTPEGWTEVEAMRALNHFNLFGLGEKFTLRATDSLVTALAQMTGMQNAGITPDAIETVLLRPGVEKAPFPNHWQRGMYQALIETLHDRVGPEA